jgi:hypothetical protein
MGHTHRQTNREFLAANLSETQPKDGAADGGVPRSARLAGAEREQFRSKRRKRDA